MSEYAEARRNAGRPAAEAPHRPPQHAQETPFAPRGPAPARRDALAESLNRSARVQSLLQTKQMLHDSPRMQAQRALQRALNPGFDRAAIQREATVDEEAVAQAQYEPVQRQAESAVPGEEDEEMLQGKFDPVQQQPATESEPAQPADQNRIGLPDNLKTGVEALSGFSLSDVRVHYNSPQPATVQAHAYAQGTDIHVGPGQEKHLPHEAWHVVQQQQGRVKPTLQMKGVAINDDAGLEREATLRGQEALRAKRRAAPTSAPGRQTAIMQFATFQIRKTDGTISGVSDFPSRPTRSSRSGQGQHTTAYVSFEGMIVSHVYNKTLKKAAKSLSELLDQFKSEYLINPNTTEKWIFTSYNQTDFVKARVAVEVQFWKYAFVAYDLFVKHLAFFVGDVIDVGVELLPMKELQQQMSSGIGYHEGELYNLVREGRGVPAVPLILLGVAP